MKNGPLIHCTPQATKPCLGAFLLLLLAVYSLPLFAQKGKEVAKPEVGAGLVWPPPPGKARIKFVCWYTNEFDVGAKKRTGFLDRLAGKSKDSLSFKQPIGVAVDDEGQLFVADAQLGVVGMDAAKHKMWFFSRVSGAVMGTATGIAVDSKFVYATDSAQSQLVVFDKEGHRTMALTRSDGIKSPVGVAVDEAKDLVVLVNKEDHQVLLLNRSLKILKKVGSRGNKPGQFNFPTFCAILPGTGFIVADTYNFRLQIFNYEGKFLRSIGQQGDYSGSFSMPKGVAVSPDGNIFAVDAKFCNFQIFRPDSQLLLFVGAGGNMPAFFQNPTGITIGKDGALYVADTVNGRIQRFQYIMGIPDDPPVAAKPPATP